MEELQELQEIVGRNIKARRLELGLSMREVSEKSGVSEYCMWQIEGGNRNSDLHTLIAIAISLDISLAELIKE